jgi:hypothetical protein
LSGKADDWKIQKQFFKNSNRKWSWLCPFLFLYTYHQFHKDKQHLLFGVEMGHFEEHQRQRLAFFGVLNRVWSGGGFYGRAGLHVLLSVVQQSIEKIGICFTEFSSITDKSLSEALIFSSIWRQIVHWITSSVHENCKLRTWGEHVVYTNCFCFDIQKNLCTQHVFSPCYELGIFMYWTGNSMNNLLSYCGLVDTKIRASYIEFLEDRPEGEDVWGNCLYIKELHLWDR